MDLLAEPKREGIHVLPRVGVLFSLFVLLCLLTAVKPKADTVTRIQFGMRVGQTVQLKLKGVNESVIWRVASGKKRVGRAKAQYCSAYKRSRGRVERILCRRVRLFRRQRAG